MDNTCKFNAAANMVLMGINRDGSEEIDEILNYTIKSLIDHLQELYNELSEEARDLTIGEMIDKIMEEEPEETDSETEDPAE